MTSNFDAARELYEDEDYCYAEEQLAIDDVKTALAEWEMA